MNQKNKRWRKIYDNGFTYLWSPIGRILEIIEEEKRNQVYLVQDISDKQYYRYFSETDDLVKAKVTI